MLHTGGTRLTWVPHFLVCGRAWFHPRMMVFLFGTCAIRLKPILMHRFGERTLPALECYYKLVLEFDGYY